ncbi:hypothetical protein [Dyella ginsengisoli]|uniref:hypothetical protein n=1 Tax=Dyella ginsengisoli TaxID=363848 RepID=UPI00037B9B7B|nr:hypothetical protein [Dyella ginsengisoli]
MKSPLKPLSLTDIHEIYGSSPTKQGEAAKSPLASYKRSEHFKRDAGHSGMQPAKLDPLGKLSRFGKR